jgi:hypothetical protein
MKLKQFELITPGGRRILVKAKSMRTLNKRLSKREREDCLIHELKPGAKLKPVESYQNLCASHAAEKQDCLS